jgi:mono/diheme cytochrome c family protein
MIADLSHERAVSGWARRLGLLGSAWGLSMVGCTSLDLVAPPVAGLQGGGGAMISEGRHLYLTTCTKCHAAEPVRDYTASEWAEIIPEMAEESHFTPSQTAAVAAYIEAVLRTSPVPGGAVQ